MEKMESALNTVQGMFSAYFAAQAPRKVTEAKIDEARLKISKLHERIAKLEGKMRKQRAKEQGLNPAVEAKYLQPIADAIKPHFPGLTVEVLGPFGLSATSAIHVYKEVDHKKEFAWSMSFRFDFDTGEIGYVDVASNSGEFPPGSMGDRNGMNYKVVQITSDMTIEELIQKGR